MSLFLLCLFSLLAGFVDSVAGGGGLIQLPAAFLYIPTLAGATVPATILGTNKFASFCGTSFAVSRYMKHFETEWRIVAPASLFAAAFSFLGARTVALVAPGAFRVVMIALIAIMAVAVIFQPKLGASYNKKHTPRAELCFAIIMGSAIGFYDGFFGPGTGSILIFLLVGIFGLDFLRASAAAKIINLVTNLFALIHFAGAGNVLYQIALPMAACNILGSVFGTKLAIAKGSSFVRALFLVVVGGILFKLAYDSFS